MFHPLPEAKQICYNHCTSESPGWGADIVSCEFFVKGLFITMTALGSRFLRTLRALIVVARANCSLIYDFLLVVSLVLIMLMISSRSLKRAQRSDKLALREERRKEYLQTHGVQRARRRHDIHTDNTEWEGLVRAQVRERQPNFGLDAAGSNWVSVDPTKPETAADYEDHFVRFALDGTISFITGGKRYDVDSCQPCSIRFTVCAYVSSDFVQTVPVRQNPNKTILANIPFGGKFHCGLTDALGTSEEFVWYAGRILFVSRGPTSHEVHHVQSCKPCGPRYSVCNEPGFTGERIPVEVSNRFSCTLAVALLNASTRVC